ncbi:MAG: hypothetical protein U1F42_03170 [Candidatus Competibacteraceae bacterium]
MPNLLFAAHADAEALMTRFLKRSPRRTLISQFSAPGAGHGGGGRVVVGGAQ